jgi:hypothetical protein
MAKSAGGFSNTHWGVLPSRDSLLLLLHLLRGGQVQRWERRLLLGPFDKY